MPFGVGLAQGECRRRWGIIPGYPQAIRAGELQGFATRSLGLVQVVAQGAHGGRREFAKKSLPNSGTESSRRAANA
jgi:hypothetical protein